MKKINFSLIMLLIISSSALADNAWIGQASVESITVYPSYSRSKACNESAVCLKVVFQKSAKYCDSIVFPIGIKSRNFLESMLLVSITSGKKIKVLADSEHCNDPDRLNLDQIELY